MVLLAEHGCQPCLFLCGSCWWHNLVFLTGFLRRKRAGSVLFSDVAKWSWRELTSLPSKRLVMCPTPGRPATAKPVRLAASASREPASTRLSTMSSRPPTAIEVPAMYREAFLAPGLDDGGKRRTVTEEDRAI